jgi:hypothetical protein
MTTTPNRGRDVVGATLAVALLVTNTFIVGYPLGDHKEGDRKGRPYAERTGAVIISCLLLAILPLPMTTALAVIAMSEAKKQSRISPYFMLYFSGLLWLVPRNDGYAERTGTVIISCLLLAIFPLPMTATPNREVAKQPEGLNFHNRRSSTCGSTLSNNCLKGRTDIVNGRTDTYIEIIISPAFLAVV